MNCSHIIEGMVWSYSRLTTFEDCKYKFFLSYLKRIKSRSLFFAEYGTFMHVIIQKYLSGELGQEDLKLYYLTNFRQNVVSRAPNQKIFQNYFAQGLMYLDNLIFPYNNILAVEEQLDFRIGDKEFTGIIDCVAKDDGITVVDNKSRALQQRSLRFRSHGKNTKTDIELDEYLRQLYMYAIPIKEKYGEYPQRLSFNCFRTNTLIEEPFDINYLKRTEDWALSTIDAISQNDSWEPSLEYFKCNYICGLHHQCEYYQLIGGDLR